MEFIVELAICYGFSDWLNSRLLDGGPEGA
jgi:hypothetical protein